MAWLGMQGDVSSTPPLATDFPPFLWHAHEMLFGYTIAVVAGFLLTASPSWTGKPPIMGAALAVLAGTWIIGRLAAWFSAVAPAAWVAVADLAFLPILLVFLLRTLAGGSPRYYVVLGVLVVLFAANAMVHMERLGLTQDTAQAGHGLALDVFIVLITVIAGRVVQAFTRNAIRKANPDSAADPLPPRPWLDRLSILSVLAVLIAGLITPGGVAIGWLALAAAILNGLRLAGWKGWRVKDQSIAWVLHLGYAWLVTGLAVRGWALAGGDLAETTALHVLTVGAIGTMTLAIMTRAALGHTGRDLKVPPAITAAYLIISAATVLRVGGPLAAPDFQHIAIILAGAGWCLAFAIFSVVFWPILTGPPPTVRSDEWLKGSGQSQNVFGNIAKDQVGGDRRHLEQPGFTEFPFDIVFFRKAKPAVGLQTHIGGGPRRIGRQQLGDVGLVATRLAGIEQPDCLLHHQVGGLGVRMSAGNGKLDTLILADGPVEHASFASIGAGLFDKPAGIPNGLGRNQKPLGIQSIQ